MAEPLIVWRQSDYDQYRGIARQVLDTPPGRPGQPPVGAGRAPRGIHFYNDSGSTIPRRAVMAVTGYSSYDEDGETYVFVKVKQPSTTFYADYLLNGDEEVEAGKYGFAPFQDPWKYAHDPSWTPATGESGGPKPGSWLLWKGYPSICSVRAVADSTNKLLLGTLAPITTLLCKTVGAQTVGTISTGDYKIWSGGVTGGADSGFTTLPDIYIQRDLENDEYFLAHLVNGKWITPKGGSGGGGATIHQTTLTADCAIGAASAVTAAGTFDNPMGYGGASGAAAYYCDVDGTDSIIGISIVSVDLVKNVIDTGPDVQQIKVTAGIHAVETEGDASLVFEWNNCVEVEG